MGTAGSISRPIVPAALAYLCGTAAGLALGGRLSSLSVVPAALTLVAALLAAAFAVLCRPSRLPLALAALAATGLLRAVCAANSAGTSESLFVNSCDSYTPVTVRGEVFAVQRPLPASRGELRYRFKLRNADFRFRGSPMRLDSPVWVIWFAKPPDAGGVAPRRGMEVEIHGLVKRRWRGSDEPRSLDDVNLVSRARETRILRDLSTGGFLSRLRARAAETLMLGIGQMPEETSLLLAMTLGYRNDLPQDLMDAFRRAGTIHVFAISGLHVAAIAAILVYLLSFVGISRTYVVLPLAPILAAYVFMTGMQPSAVRAAGMVTIYLLAPLLGRRPDALGSVALTLLAILAWNPLQIRELSLILSFAMVLGIILLTGPAVDLFLRLFDSPLALEERKLAILSEQSGDPDARVVRWPLDFLIVVRHALVTVFAGAFAAALVSFPLTAYFFGTLTPYAVLANTIVVPLAFPLMAVAGIGLLLSIVFPPVVYLTNTLAAWLAWLMKTVSTGVAAIPGAAIETDFPLWALALWYLGLFALLRLHRRQGS